MANDRQKQYPGSDSTQPTALEAASDSKLSSDASRDPALKAVAPFWRPGDVILDLYEVKQVYESGGIGLVYRVRHRGWNVDLAVKSPRPEFLRTEQHRQNFEREAETWVNLGLHPHTVSCFYVRRLGDIPRIFAEYVEGGSLADWIHRGTLYVRWAGAGAGAHPRRDHPVRLGAAPRARTGLVHQDVKPANVLMTPDGTAKVTDFGLARARALASGDAASAQPGQSVMVTGAGYTQQYASPEQLKGLGLTRRTDIWSWGVSVLEMFSRTYPAVGSLAPELLEMYSPEGPEMPVMPPAVTDLLRHCFQQKPEARPKDMFEIAAALQETYLQITGSRYPRQTPIAAEALAGSLNNRAASLLDLGKTEQAEQVWEQALQADPHHPEATYNLGLVRWRSGGMTDLALAGC